jgi:hypothetical protein
MLTTADDADVQTLYSCRTATEQPEWDCFLTITREEQQSSTCSAEQYMLCSADTSVNADQPQHGQSAKATAAQNRREKETTTPSPTQTALPHRKPGLHR